MEYSYYKGKLQGISLSSNVSFQFLLSCFSEKGNVLYFLRILNFEKEKLHCRRTFCYCLEIGKLYQFQILLAHIANKFVVRIRSVIQSFEKNLLTNF